MRGAVQSIGVNDGHLIRKGVMTTPSYKQGAIKLAWTAKSADTGLWSLIAIRGWPEYDSCRTEIEGEGRWSIRSVHAGFRLGQKAQMSVMTVEQMSIGHTLYRILTNLSAGQHQTCTFCTLVAVRGH